MRKNRFQGLYWHIETKLPIAFLKLISTLKLSKGKSYASKIRNTFQVTQEYITLVEKIGTCSRYHPNAMSKITANGWYLGPRLTCKSCKYPIEDMRACLVCTKYTVYSTQYTKTELKYHSYRGLAIALSKISKPITLKKDSI